MRSFEIHWAKEALDMPPQTHEEEMEYRDGYSDGFIAAVNAIFDMWFMGKHRAYDSAFKHWRGVLRDWRLFRQKQETWLPPGLTSPVCVYCGKHRSEHIDHVIPKSRGGTDDKDNLVFACSKCNLSKYNYTLDEWRK